MSPQIEVRLVGHPLVPIGMGEHLRSVFRALRAVGVNVAVRDVYGIGGEDPDIRRGFEGHLVEELSPDINIFCLNGDEVEPSLKHLGTVLAGNAFNIVYPLWELSTYPRVWAEQLDRFDEVWTTSRFTYESVRTAITKPVLHMPLAVEASLATFLGRRYFNIPESAFVFLFFFDFTSYIQRKNPFAVIKAFEELCNRRADDDLCLVVKIKGARAGEKDYDLFREYIARCNSTVIVIDKVLNDNEMRNLLRCSDSFVSLHRSEGFGLGLISAMFLGKPVVATGYSGNLEFMTEENSCLVRYDLCNVPKGAYPFYQGQVWAEPDVSHAVEHMLRLVSDRSYARRIGEIASRHIRVNFSFRASGLRYLNRLDEIRMLREKALEAPAGATLLATMNRDAIVEIRHREQLTEAAPPFTKRYGGYRAQRIATLLRRVRSANCASAPRRIAAQIVWRLYNSLSSNSRSRLLKLYSMIFGRA